MMFTYWPRPVASFPAASFSQLSLPDLFDLDMSNHRCQCRSSALFAPHSFPKGIDSGEFYHSLRQNEPTENTRSTGTQTDGAASFSGVRHLSEKVQLTDPHLANFCAQLAQRLMDISDGWAAQLEFVSSGEPPEGMFGRICASFFRLW